MQFIFMFIALMSFSKVAISSPNINPGPLYEFIDSQQNTLLKRIRNTGDSTAYVRISVSEIIYTGNTKVQEKPLDMNMLIQGKGEGLVASPARMMIPAAAVQANRLFYVGPRNKERYFRVRYVPIVPASGKEFGLSEKEISQYKSGLSAGINVMAGYGAIVTVRPRITHYSTDINEQGKEIVITNNGNSTVTLEGFVSCNKNKKCSTPIVRHLIPGSRFQQPKENGYSYRFTLIEGATEKNVRLGQR